MVYVLGVRLLKRPAGNRDTLNDHVCTLAVINNILMKCRIICDDDRVPLVSNFVTVIGLCIPMLHEEGDHADTIMIVNLPFLHYMGIKMGHLLSHLMLEQAHSVVIRKHHLYAGGYVVGAFRPPNLKRDLA